MRKKLVASVPDLAPLHLGERKTREVLGDVHHWQPDGEDHLLVCHPPNWRIAEKLLTSLGATVLPWHGAAWQQHQQLFDKHKWPKLDPMED